MSFIRKIKRNGRVYLAEVENQRVNGKVVQQFIRYAGIDPSSERDAFPSCANELDVTKCQIHGSVLVLHEIAKKLGLPVLLANEAAPILSLVYAHCHRYRSVSDTSQWFEKTNLPELFGVAKISEKMLHNSLGSLESLNLDWLQESIFENLSNLCEEDKSGVIYDGTNTYLRGTNASLAKKGKDKEGVRGRNLIQIGLGVTRKWGFPIFHHTQAGNIHDAKLFGEAITKFRHLGYRSGLVVFDRGITSKTNISDLSADRWKVLCGVPCHEGIKQAISKMDLSDVESFRYRVSQGDNAFYVKSSSFQIGNSKGKLLVLVNPLKRAKMREKRLIQITRAREILNSGQTIEGELASFFNTNGAVNTHAIQRYQVMDGLSFLFTNSKISNQEAVEQYFAKDLVEKAFQLFKGALELHPIRFWLDNKIKAHVTICYLSYCLLSTFRYLLVSKGITQSPLAALDELSEVYKVSFKKTNPVGKKNNNAKTIEFSRIITLTKSQEKIIKAVIPELEM